MGSRLVIGSRHGESHFGGGDRGERKHVRVVRADVKLGGVLRRSLKVVNEGRKVCRRGVSQGRGVKENFIANVIKK